MSCQGGAVVPEALLLGEVRIRSVMGFALKQPYPVQPLSLLCTVQYNRLRCLLLW
jgi:hypothetical protein